MIIQKGKNGNQMQQKNDNSVDWNVYIQLFQEMEG